MHYLQIREKLSEYRVGIAGCGGLGSNCAVALARVGVGELVLADFDVIEESNLNRQYFFQHQLGMHKALALAENIKLTGSCTRVLPHVIRLNPQNCPEVFASCDVVVEAFDQAREKKMLIETMMNANDQLWMVSGSGMAGWGSSETLGIHRYEKLIICGDLTTEVRENLSPIAPRVGIVANMQANTVMEILLGKMR